MPAEKSAKPPKSAPGPAAKASAAPAAKTPAAPAKAASKKPAPAPTAPAAKTGKAVPVKNAAEQTKVAATKPANDLPKSKPASANKPAAPAGNTPKKTPAPAAAAATTAAAAAAATRAAPPKRDPKPKVAGNQSADPGSTVVAPARSDDTDLSDVEADLEGEVEEVPEAAVEIGKGKPLRMKISKAKERALRKEFGLDESVLSEEDLARRRSRLKTLIKLGKTRGYLTHVEISDHLTDKLVDAETLEAVITTLNDLGVAVYEQTPDAEALIITDNAPTGA